MLLNEKKGYIVCCFPEYARACVRCYKTKSKCQYEEEGGPCMRCTRIKRECVRRIAKYKRKDHIELVDMTRASTIDMVESLHEYLGMGKSDNPF